MREVGSHYSAPIKWTQTKKAIQSRERESKSRPNAIRSKEVLIIECFITKLN